MANNFVGKYTYDDFCRKVRYGDPNLTVDKLKEMCEFLDGKQYEDDGKIIKNILPDFIYQIVRKPRYEPEYDQQIIEFVKSDYFSDKIKKDVYKIIKHLSGYERVSKMLRSKLNMNDFDLEALNDINEAFYEYSERKEVDKDVNVKIPVIFNKYMFVLDGNGPVTFVINNYSGEELAKEFLTNVGLVPIPTYYQNMGFNRLEFNEDHLIAIYKEFDKYIPEKKDEFVKLVKLNKDFSPYEFITNYLNFVNNNFSCNSLSISKVKKDDTEWKSKMSDISNNDVKNAFVKYINKEIKELKKTI